MFLTITHYITENIVISTAKRLLALCLISGSTAQITHLTLCLNEELTAEVIPRLALQVCIPRVSKNETFLIEITCPSLEWAAKYPTGVPDTAQLPKEWTDALAAAVAAGKIPDIPKTTATDDLGPVYPEGTNAEDPDVCSATAKCRIEGDIWDAPDGVFGLNFDDGPQPVSIFTLFEKTRPNLKMQASPKLTEFLTQNQKTATHFLIGQYITQQPAEFLGIFNAGGDLAVHTYTHPYMTSQSNEEVLAQVGWTMQIIHDSTGGRVPKYWRPPYGDTDHRVRAITREVFGLEVIMWNYEYVCFYRCSDGFDLICIPLLSTDDWALTTGGQSADKIATEMQGWLTGPKSPGLIILEHELSDQSVQAFIDAYPLIEQNGWNMMSAARCYSDTAYHNAASSTSDQVTPAGILLSEQQSSAPPAGSSSASSSDAAPSGSQSGPSSKTS